MRCVAAPHGPRRPPVTGPPSVSARLWMRTETACATMPKTAHEPTATVPGSGLATVLEMAMGTVAALAVVTAMVWALAAVTASAVLIAPALVAPSATERALAALLTTLLARAHIMVGAAGAGSACGRGRRR